MFSGESRAIDLGSYSRFDFHSCIKEKFGTFVLDEGGLSSPLSISLVIPTKFEPEGILEIEEDTLHKILAECSELVDAGYLDEIVIMGATRKENRSPDFSILQKAVRIAYEELGLFKEQVDLLNRYRSQNERAKRGLMDFFLKVVHQFDGNVSRLLARYGVFGVTGQFGVLAGKGSGIWMAVPMTRGDIVCFVDADIINFKKEFVVALCHPIIYSWKLQDAAIKFVKAYYTRITVTKEDSHVPILGGRVCRLLAVPLLQSVTKTFELYQGLEGVKYPLSGEMAVSRDILEQLSFPNNYALETSMLFQTYETVGPASVAELNLDIYRHIGQRFENLESMGYQIVESILRIINEKLGRSLTSEEKEQLARVFSDTVDRLVEEYDAAAARVKETEPNLVYSKKDEMEKAQLMKGIVADVMQGNIKEKRAAYYSFPSWRRVSERIGNFFALKEMVRRRSNQSTWSRLNECGLLSE